MDSLKISTGVKRICINDDPNNVIVFNPSDVLFAERFYELYREFESKQIEYEQRAKELDAHKNELDTNGLPVNLNQGLTFLHETCTFMRDRIDYLFGAGTSQKAFGDALSLDMVGEFFVGITPFVQAVRSEKLAQYTTNAALKRSKHKVMR